MNPFFSKEGTKGSDQKKENPDAYSPKVLSTETIMSNTGIIESVHKKETAADQLKTIGVFGAGSLPSHEKNHNTTQKDNIGKKTQLLKKYWQAHQNGNREEQTKIYKEYNNLLIIHSKVNIINDNKTLNDTSEENKQLLELSPNQKETIEEKVERLLEDEMKNRFGLGASDQTNEIEKLSMKETIGLGVLHEYKIMEKAEKYKEVDKDIHDRNSDLITRVGIETHDPSIHGIAIDTQGGSRISSIVNAERKYISVNIVDRNKQDALYFSDLLSSTWKIGLEESQKKMESVELSQIKISTIENKETINALKFFVKGPTGKRTFEKESPGFYAAMRTPSAQAILRFLTEHPKILRKPDINSIEVEWYQSCGSDTLQMSYHLKSYSA